MNRPVNSMPLCSSSVQQGRPGHSRCRPQPNAVHHAEQGNAAPGATHRSPCLVVLRPPLEVVHVPLQRLLGILPLLRLLVIVPLLACRLPPAQRPTGSLVEAQAQGSACTTLSCSECLCCMQSPTCTHMGLLGAASSVLRCWRAHDAGRRSGISKLALWDGCAPEFVGTPGHLCCFRMRARCLLCAQRTTEQPAHAAPHSLPLQSITAATEDSLPAPTPRLPRCDWEEQGRQPEDVTQVQSSRAGLHWSRHPTCCRSNSPTCCRRSNPHLL